MQHFFSIFTIHYPILIRRIAQNWCLNRKIATETFDNSLQRMIVKHFNAWEDNYMYVIFDEASKEAAAVDPVEPGKIVSFLRERGLTLKYVLTTHHHADHASGNAQLLELLAADGAAVKPIVLGGDDRVQAVSKVVSHEESLPPLGGGSIAIRCLHTPCHTSGHICYLCEAPGKQPAVFTGDTLFIAGCGRFFEGTADQMYSALVERLGRLQPETLVYCGHEYTRKNLQFAANVDPGNADVKAKLERCLADPSAPTIPSTIGEELRTNPFMRVDQPALQKHAGSNDPVKVMATLRKEKDRF